MLFFPIFIRGVGMLVLIIAFGLVGADYRLRSVCCGRSESEVPLVERFLSDLVPFGISTADGDFVL